MQIAGPAFVDPTALVLSDLRLSTAAGPSVRNYAQPASVPRRTLLLFQAFELPATAA